MFQKLRTRITATKTIAKLLSQAETFAQTGGSERPAAEHLIMAALQLPDGTAARAFERLGASAADFRASLELQEAADLERVGVSADIDHVSSHLPEPTEPKGIYTSELSAQHLFQAAGNDARRGGGSLVGAHVLRAAAALEHGPAARALRHMGIERAALEAAATAEIEAQGNR